MANKLIFKLKSDSEKSMILKTEQNKFQISDEGINKFFISVLDLAGVDYKAVDKLAETEDLHNLHLLIKQGFAIRVEETGEDLHFVAYKGGDSFGVIVPKQQGFTNLLKVAEDMAKEFLEESKDEKSL